MPLSSFAEAANALGAAITRCRDCRRPDIELLPPPLRIIFYADGCLRRRIDSRMMPADARRRTLRAIMPPRLKRGAEYDAKSMPTDGYYAAAVFDTNAHHSPHHDGRFSDVIAATRLIPIMPSPMLFVIAII